MRLKALSLALCKEGVPLLTYKPISLRVFSSGVHGGKDFQLERRLGAFRQVFKYQLAYLRS